MLFEFSLKRIYYTLCGKNVQSHDVHIPRNSTEYRYFYLCLLIHSKLAPKFLSSHPRQREITYSPRQHFFENLFPSTEEMGGRNYDLHYQNQSETMKMTSNIGYLYFA